MTAQAILCWIWSETQIVGFMCDIGATSWENQQFAYAKTKVQISFAVTAKLIRGFVFATRIVQSLYFLNTKFHASSCLLLLCSPVCVVPGLKPHRWFFHKLWLIRYILSSCSSSVLSSSLSFLDLLCSSMPLSAPRAATAARPRWDSILAVDSMCSLLRCLGVLLGLRKPASSLSEPSGSCLYCVLNTSKIRQENTTVYSTDINQYYVL